MGRKLRIAFEMEVENIKTEKIKKMTEEILQSCDDLNAVGAASSTGKYHPISDLGEGGLVRHSKIVAFIANILMNCRPQYDDPKARDIVYAACLLHDMCKFDKTKGESHTNFDHPAKMAAKIREMYPNDEDAERMASDIETHMSRWNTSKYDKAVLKLPENEEQYIVCYADLISANKQLPEVMKVFENEAKEKLGAE